MKSKIIFIAFFLFLLCSFSYAQQSDLTKKNKKKTGVKKKALEMKENDNGDESVYKKYQNKGSKENKNKKQRPAGLSKKEKIKSSKEMGSSSGDIEGELGKLPNVDIEHKVRVKNTVKSDREAKVNELKANSAGDIIQTETAGWSHMQTMVPQWLALPNNQKALRHDKAKEMRNNATGDIPTPEKRKLDLTKGLKMFEMTDNQKELRMQSREAASSSGDLEGVYEKQLSTEKNKGKIAGSYSGKIDADILQKIKKRMEVSDKEMGSNTGDIVGGYLAKRDKERTNNEKIVNFRGKITVDIKAIQQKAKEESHIAATNTGDILLKTIKSKENSNREKIKKATSYKGDIIVSTKTKGNHPSAVYRGGRIENSLKGKERLRKKMLRKFRRNKSVEDPKYMRKPIIQPKYEPEEYKIWEVKGRGMGAE